VARREAAGAGKDTTAISMSVPLPMGYLRGSAKPGPISVYFEGLFAEPWPEWPAAKRQERKEEPSNCRGRFHLAACPIAPMVFAGGMVTVKY